MTQFRIRDAAALLGVSDDTVRRWIRSGELTAGTDDAGRKVVDGAELAALSMKLAHTSLDPSGVASSARNQFVGLVTRVTSDTVMSQVELQCGPHRIVSLLSTEAVRELGIGVGSLAVARVKATMVTVEAPKEQ